MASTTALLRALMPRPSLRELEQLDPTSADFQKAFKDGELRLANMPIQTVCLDPPSKLANAPARVQYEVTFTTLRGYKLDVDHNIKQIGEWIAYAKRQRDHWVHNGMDGEALDDEINAFQIEVERLSRNDSEQIRHASIRQVRTWLNDARGRLMMEELSPILDSPLGSAGRISNDGIKAIRQAMEHLCNTSWELCELLNWIRLQRFSQKEDKDNALTYADLKSLSSYVSKCNAARKGKLVLEEATVFSLSLSSSLRRRLNLVYTEAGFLMYPNPQSLLPSTADPPLFPGEEHLEVIDFYRKGGTWKAREVTVGLIEKKAKTRVRFGDKAAGDGKVGGFTPQETLRMRAVQAGNSTATLTSANMSAAAGFAPQAGNNPAALTSANVSAAAGFADSSIGFEDDDDDEETLVEASATPKKTVWWPMTPPASAKRHIPVPGLIQVQQVTSRLRSSTVDQKPARVGAAVLGAAQKRRRRRRAGIPGLSPKARCLPRWEVKAWRPRPTDYFVRRRRKLPPQRS